MSTEPQAARTPAVDELRANPSTHLGHLLVHAPLDTHTYIIVTTMALIADDISSGLGN